MRNRKRHKRKLSQLEKMKRKVGNGSLGAYEYFSGYLDQDRVEDKYFVATQYPPVEFKTELGEFSPAKMSIIGLILAALYLLR